MKSVISKDGTKIVYEVSGSGPALIYVTGAICFRKFTPIVGDVKKFATEFTVYNYDRRGRGDSGNTLPWSIEREIEDIEALIDVAGGEAFLYGHSSGAVLTLEASLRLAKKVKKAVLYDASYVHDKKEQADYTLLRQKIQALLDSGENAKAIKTFLREIGMPKFFIALLPLFPGWKTMKALAPTLAYDINLTSDLPPVARAAKNTVPTQVIVGQKSPAALHSVASQLAGAIPGAKLVKLANQDHMVSAEAVLPLLVSFLKSET